MADLQGPQQSISITDAFVRNLTHQGGSYPDLVWDSKISGLTICVQPTGHKTWKCIYSFNRKPRWLTLGKADIIDVNKARSLAAEALLKVATGVDVQAEKQATRGEGTFEELHTQYLEQYAKKRNEVHRGSDILGINASRGARQMPSKQLRDFGADDRPACRSCGKPMHLIRRGPHPDYVKYETQTFLCPSCNHEEIRSADVIGHPHL